MITRLMIEIKDKLEVIDKYLQGEQYLKYYEDNMAIMKGVLDRKNKKINNLQERIDKAIEYCEKELNDGRSLENQWLMGCYDTCKELLDILKGEEK